MRKTFKYRLLGNKAVFEKTDSWLYLCRWLYNTALEQRISIYRQNKGKISCYDQINQLPELKDHFSEYGEVSSQTLQDVIERLDKAYSNFFRRIKKGTEKSGFPRFRGKDRYDSFTLKQCGWKLDGKYLTIKKMGRFKMRLSRPIEGDIKTITIRKESNKWYACFSCDNVSEKKLLKLNNSIGLDVGIKSFLVDSEGIIIDNPKFLRKSEVLLRVRQRTLSRRKKGSNRRNDARILVSKVHKKVINQRNDFLHKLANQYISKYGTLVFEDLNIKGMVKNRHLAKSINDASWGKFYELCAYKAEEAGRQIVRVNRFEPTSKKCSQCGAINQELKLCDRKWICSSCGTLHARDHNAAKNIRAVGQTV
ncbi:MAG: transposase [Patescibacteria group bacterium]|jgi:putative transposase